MNGTIYVGSDDGYLSAFGQSPSLAVTKSVLPASTAPGGAVTYTLQVQNTGEGGASHVILTDTLPAGISYVPNSAEYATYDAASRTLTWSISQGVVPGGSLGYSFNAIVDSSATVGSTISNTAYITCSEVPNGVTSNIASFTVTAAQRGDWWMFHHDAQHTGRSAVTGPASPSLQWNSPTQGALGSSPAFGADGTIYVGSYDHNLYAFNPKDGSLKWRFTTGNVNLVLPGCRAGRDNLRRIL